MEICPLEVEWGNVADWAAVAVAAAGALAVWLVTKAANRTASASHELAKQLKERDEEFRTADRTVLTTLIYGEIMSAQLQYAELLEELVQDGSFEWAVESDRTKQLVAQMSKGPSLQRTKESSQRFNLLPKELAQQIASGISMIDLCSLNADSFLEAMDRDQQRRAFDALVNSIDGASIAFTAAHERMKEVMSSH
ncbi:hypothetical protein [Stenotrophomonas maltophilia]|uniref:hypothetical protein n=1 Tax=Stenotrophomonas maltophilia TaxID=40324 RepID=UPI00066D7084|nr:hypothetical protein [Stenotrophomonas maltophilia]